MKKKKSNKEKKNFSFWIALLIILIIIAAAIILIKSFTGYAVNQIDSKLECYDSDGGKNLHNKGQVYSKGVLVITDSCYSKKTSTEGYCLNNRYYSLKQDCPSGYSCSDGACIISCNNECEYFGQMKCFENYSKVCGKFDNDVCFEWSSGEFCEKGCNNGACLPACSDNDGGKNIYLKGITNNSNESKADFCLESNPEKTVVEFWCRNSSIDVYYEDCARGYRCSNGVCVVSDRNTGYVYAISYPEGALVYIDNVYRGISPVQILNLKQGKHSIAFSKEGYERKTDSIDVMNGNLNVVNVSLIKSK